MALPTSDNTVNVTRFGSTLSRLWTKIKTKFGTKADLNSPAFTGTPTAPTAADGTNTTQIATTAFVKQAVIDGMATADAMQYKGTITLGTTSPGAYTAAASKGHTYKVVKNGTDERGYVDGVAVEAGDMIICNADSTAAATSSNYTTIATKWDFVQGNLDGVVIGPASAVDGQIPVFDGATGKLIKDSGKTLTVTSTSVSDGTTTFNKYTHPAVNHIPSGGSSGQFLGWDSSGTAKWVSNPNSDTKVKATAKTDDVNYKILATASASPTSGNATEAVYDTDITLNPSTNTIAANISGSSASCTGNAATATTAQNYDTSTGTIKTALDGKVDFGLSNNSSSIGNDAPAADCISYWGSDNIPNNHIKMVYNQPGYESTLIFSKRSTYGSIVKYGYEDKYIYILRNQNGTWKSNDWEKISAGYADSAELARWAKGMNPTLINGASNQNYAVFAKVVLDTSVAANTVATLRFRLTVLGTNTNSQNMAMSDLTFKLLPHESDFWSLCERIHRADTDSTTQQPDSDVGRCLFWKNGATFYVGVYTGSWSAKVGVEVVSVSGLGSSFSFDVGDFSSSVSGSGTATHNHTSTWANNNDGAGSTNLPVYARKDGKLETIGSKLELPAATEAWVRVQQTNGASAYLDSESNKGGVWVNNGGTNDWLCYRDNTGQGYFNGNASSATTISNHQLNLIKDGVDAYVRVGEDSNKGIALSYDDSGSTPTMGIWVRWASGSGNGKYMCSCDTSGNCTFNGTASGSLNKDASNAITGSGTGTAPTLLGGMEEGTSIVTSGNVYIPTTDSAGTADGKWYKRKLSKIADFIKGKGLDGTQITNGLYIDGMSYGDRVSINSGYVYGWKIGSMSNNDSYANNNFKALVVISDWGQMEDFHCNDFVGVLDIGSRMNSSTVSTSNWQLIGRLTSVLPQKTSGANDKRGWAVFCKTNSSTYKSEWYIGKNSSSAYMNIGFRYSKITLLPLFEYGWTRELVRETTGNMVFNSGKDDWWSQHLTPTIGATTYSVGSSNLPVYVDSNKQIQAIGSKLELPAATQAWVRVQQTNGASTYLDSESNRGGVWVNNGGTSAWLCYRDNTGNGYFEGASKYIYDHNNGGFVKLEVGRIGTDANTLYII